MTAQEATHGGDVNVVLLDTDTEPLGLSSETRVSRSEVGPRSLHLNQHTKSQSQVVV
jgi:hypothetical protein